MSAGRRKQPLAPKMIQLGCIRVGILHAMKDPDPSMVPSTASGCAIERSFYCLKYDISNVAV